MATLLYAWEFGSALGHLGAFLPLARRLAARGHTLRFVLADTATGAAVLGPHGFGWLQAPVVAEAPRPGAPLSYADILLRFGYDDPARLRGPTVAWRELLQLAGADLVLSDHAPTAILAARTLGLPVCTYSYGFCVPPPLDPTPNMRPWLSADPAALRAADARATQSINAVLAAFDRPPLPNVAALFDVAETALTTFPELDHYAHCRGDASYWGCLVSAVAGDAPAWPAGTGPRIFAYLRRALPHAEATLAALGRSGCPCVVVFPDIPEDMLVRCHVPNLVVSRTPLDTQRALQEADLAVTYGGHGLSTAFLLAGKPLLLVPGQLEQYLLARRVEAIGAGLCVAPDEPAAVLAQRLDRLRGDAHFSANAQAFARKYAAFPQERIIDNLVRRIEEIVAADEPKETS
jgi:UDP:flavonoid glycosyltransferase YjiC (YdhE family)